MLTIEREEDERRVLLSIAGWLDTRHARQLELALDRVVADRPCVLDLSLAPRVDSSGFGCLLSFYKRFEAHTIPLALVVGAGHPLTPLSRALHVQLPLYFTRAEALGALGLTH